MRYVFYFVLLMIVLVSIAACSKLEPLYNVVPWPPAEGRAFIYTLPA